MHAERAVIIMAIIGIVLFVVVIVPLRILILIIILSLNSIKFLEADVTTQVCTFILLNKTLTASYNFISAGVHRCKCIDAE